MLNGLGGEAILGEPAASARPIYTMIFIVTIWFRIGRAAGGAGSFLIIDGGFQKA